jgi:site-specific DNA-methyltransferase (adenine-specific)
VIHLADAINIFVEAAKKPSKPKVVRFRDGIVIHGEFGSEEVAKLLKPYEHKLPLLISDPPYGILPDYWDKNITADDYIRWTLLMLKYMRRGAAAYVWGCIGKKLNRIFFEYLSRVEKETGMTLQNLITWSKRRSYGTKNYLMTREEVAYLTNGDKPSRFKIPLLDVKRGYKGFNKDYPALSDYKRRTNVWQDIPEILSGKRMVAEKPTKLAEIMIETHTRKGDTVLDPFAGSGSTGSAARNLGRKFILIERDKKNFDIIVRRLKNEEIKKKAEMFAALSA